MKTIKIASALMLAATMSLFTACNSYEFSEVPENIEESVKDLSGVWQLQEVTRNNIDISNEMDFTNFNLVLNSNNTYAIENYLPFLVKESGRWSVDDPRRPMLITFEETSGQNRSVDVEISYPVVAGERQLTISLSPGCPGNKYKYKFIRKH